MDVKNQEEASRDASLAPWRRETSAPYTFIFTGLCWTFLLPLVFSQEHLLILKHFNLTFD